VSARQAGPRRTDAAGPVHSATISARTEAGETVTEGTNPTVSTTEPTDVPIYTRLVRERSDILNDVRQAAEETWREVGRTMDFRLPRRGNAAH